MKRLFGMAEQVAEKWSDVVILSEAKNLLFARGIEKKADSSARQEAPGFRMKPQRAFSASCEAMSLRLCTAI